MLLKTGEGLLAYNSFLKMRVSIINTHPYFLDQLKLDSLRVYMTQGIIQERIYLSYFV